MHGQTVGPTVHKNPPSNAATPHKPVQRAVGTLRAPCQTAVACVIPTSKDYLPENDLEKIVIT